MSCELCYSYCIPSYVIMLCQRMSVLFLWCIVCYGFYCMSLHVVMCVYDRLCYCYWCVVCMLTCRRVIVFMFVLFVCLFMLRALLVLVLFVMLHCIVFQFIACYTFYLLLWFDMSADCICMYVCIYLFVYCMCMCMLFQCYVVL